MILKGPKINSKMGAVLNGFQSNSKKNGFKLDTDLIHGVGCMYIETQMSSHKKLGPLDFKSHDFKGSQNQW